MNAVNINKKNKKYQTVTNNLRATLIEMVLEKKINVKSAAKETGINYNTAKTILRIYKKEKRFLRKNTPVAGLEDDDDCAKDSCDFDNVDFNVHNQETRHMTHRLNTMNDTLSVKEAERSSFDINRKETWAESRLFRNLQDGPMRPFIDTIHQMNNRNETFFSENVNQVSDYIIERYEELQTMFQEINYNNAMINDLMFTVYRIKYFMRNHSKLAQQGI